MSITEKLQEAIEATHKTHSKLFTARSRCNHAKKTQDVAEIEHRAAYSRLTEVLAEEIRLPPGE